MSETKSTARYRPETRLVHSGTLRSQYGETSEALFLTQGFVYDSAEQCEARFKGEDPGFLYSRFSNPNISMFERRMIELEGAEAARATATGMAAVTTAILAPLKAGDHVVAAKAGLVGLTRALAHDLAPKGVTVNCVVPGLIETRRTSASAHAGRESLLGRRGTPEEVAAAVRYLAGPGARYVTGQTLHVNGGGFLSA
jgi:O-succinylhomoserine sulfhydrylase